MQLAGLMQKKRFAFIFDEKKYGKPHDWQFFK